MKALLIVSLVVLALGQQKPDGPMTLPILTETQKLQLQNVSQRLEIAQLKAQAAQRDFDAARIDLQALLKTLEKEDYVLDLQTLTYTRKPTGEKK